MRLVLFILSVIILSGCTGQQSSDENRNGTTFQVVKDTVLNGYHTEISMQTDQLRKGRGNEIQIKVDGIQPAQILLYTKVPEATVKPGKEPNRFLVLPTEKAEEVNINISAEENGKIVKVGVISLGVK